MNGIRYSVAGLLLPLLAGCAAETPTSWRPAAASRNEAAKSPAAEADSPPKEPKKQPTVLIPKIARSAALKPQTRELADFELTERDGRPITRKDLLGKPAVVCFIFTQCYGPCGSVSGEMKKLQDWAATQKIDAQLVSVTVDPRRDTPEVLREYAKNFGADKDRWWFLTGKKEQIDRFVRSSLGQRIVEIPGAQKGYEIDHSLSAVLLDAKGQIVNEYVIRNPVAFAQLQQRLERWKRTGSFAKP